MISEETLTQLEGDLQNWTSDMKMRLLSELRLLREVAVHAEKKPWLKLTASDYRLEELITKWRQTT